MIVALAACFAACATQSRSGDPFADAPERTRPSGRPQRVRLEVVCRDCTITYTIVARTTSAVARSPVWRVTFDRYPRFPEALRLSASGYVEAVRIYVNGELVASRERRAAETYTTLAVEAVVPTEADQPVPDTVRAEGAAPPM